MFIPTPPPQLNPIEVLKRMLLQRGIEIHANSFDEPRHVVSEPVDLGLFEAGEVEAFHA